MLSSNPPREGNASCDAPALTPSLVLVALLDALGARRGGGRVVERIGRCDDRRARRHARSAALAIGRRGALDVVGASDADPGHADRDRSQKNELFHVASLLARGHAPASKLRRSGATCVPAPVVANSRAKAPAQ